MHVDPHILRLVGTSLYRKCMRFCAENLVIFLDNGRICPLPGYSEALCVQIMKIHMIQGVEKQFLEFLMFQSSKSLLALIAGGSSVNTAKPKRFHGSMWSFLCDFSLVHAVSLHQMPTSRRI